jgi:ATP-binding cassette, subfamily B, bacterial
MTGRDLTIFQEVRKVFFEIIYSFIRQSKLNFLILVLIIITSTVLSILAPYVFSEVINEIGENKYLSQLSLGLFIYALLIGLSLIFDAAATHIAIIFSEKVQYLCSIQFFKKLFDKSPTFFIKHNPAEIQAMQSNGISALNRVMQLSTIYFIPSILQIILSCTLLGIQLNLTVVLIVFVYGILFITVSYILNKNIRTHLDMAIDAEQSKAQLVGNSISMIETLRYFNAGIWMEQKFQKNAQKVFKNIRLYSIKNIRYSLLFGVGICVQFLITFYIFIPEVNAGRMNVGDLVLFNALLLQLNKPFEYIGMSILNFNAAYIEFKPFAKMWNAEDLSEPSLGKNILIKNVGKLEFKDVSFHYENGRGIDHVNFIAQKGKIVFLFGESGKGKSTILKLALKSLIVEQGKILVDDIDLKTIHRNEWFSKIGVIPQEVMMLNDSIQNNICLGREYHPTRLYKSAEKAKILNRILEMPDGFNALVGERGLMLSGGEKQRIAIARALYAEPEFLFLDEASSSLDHETELEIMQHIRTLKHDMTIIVITHNHQLINIEEDEVIYI